MKECIHTINIDDNYISHIINEEVERLTQLRIEAIERINNDVKDCISAEIRDNLKISDFKAESLATSIIEYAQQLKDKHNDDVKDFIKHIIMFTDFSKALSMVNGFYENIRDWYITYI